MKSFTLIFALMMLWTGCHSTKNIAWKTWQSSPQTEELGNGMIKTVRIKVYRDTVFETRIDGAKKIYPVLQPTKDSAVIRLEVAYDLKEPLPDSRQNYILLIPVSNPLKIPTNKPYVINPEKVLYGFLAFHPQSGYRFLDSGKIFLEKDKKGHIRLTVKLDENQQSVLNGTYLIPVEKAK